MRGLMLKLKELELTSACSLGAIDFGSQHLSCLALVNSMIFSSWQEDALKLRM